MTGFLSEKLVHPFLKECGAFASKGPQREWSATTFVPGQTEWKDQSERAPDWWDAHARENLLGILVRHGSEEAYLVMVSLRGDVWVHVREPFDSQKP
jgi:hypothetical protein